MVSFGPFRSVSVNRDTEMKQQNKMKIRQSYDLYIEDVLDLNSNSDRKDQNTAIELTDSNKGQSQFSIKKLFSLIKNSRQDSEGIAPLQISNSENLAIQSKDKADIAISSVPWITP